jgi:RNA polymerase sigma-70 factor, ECF subfamily
MHGKSGPAATARVDDTDLVKRAQAGDVKAMNDLLALHFGYVNALCKRTLRNPADAEEARQEALMQAARMIATFGHRSSFRTWLHTVTRNVCLNKIRIDTGKEIPIWDIDSSAKTVPGVDAAVAARLDVEAALNQVNPAFRDVLVARFVLDLEYAEIARQLDMPLNTVKSQLFRGREELIALLRQPQSPLAASKSTPGSTDHTVERR